MLQFPNKCTITNAPTKLSSHSVACPSFTYLFTAESVRMVAIGDLMFFKSHTLTVRSSLPETTLSPTVNTADVTVLQKKKKKDTQIEASCYTKNVILSLAC